MKRLVGLILLSILFLGFQQSMRGSEAVLCGWDEVFIVEIKGSDDTDIEKLWSWRAADRSDLPEQFRTLFETTDECKPVEGGKRILISSSAGGLAVVDRQSGKVLWYGYVGNAHSIELLPNDRIVVAGSTHPEGNKLAVFDLKKPNESIFEESLHSGHGVVWDQQQRLLWALGYDELRAYSLHAWETSEPGLTLQQSHHLPSESGHDLSLIPASGELLLTTNEGVYSFDIEERRFSPYVALEGLRGVKSVSIHPHSKRLAYTQAEGKDWWATRVHLLRPAGTVLMEKEHLYKVRWVPPLE